MANDDQKIIPKLFGNYLLMDHFVDGGMAKIYRARTLGQQADKIVAIKMIHPQLLKDQSFRTMFMDEIKVTFGLIHPNIAQVYDYGSHQGQLYTAMEYVDGKNLKQFAEKLRQKEFVFPVEIIVHIISQVCQGLHYAHTLTDKLSGKRINIIHRDVSPHNIMVTYDGAVKVIDFGIAKSTTNQDTTQVGTIKGKLSYIAPEYIEGMELDRRYDEFSTGITMWEMLCSRKLFGAQNDLAILKKVQTCSVPAPSSINPNIPKALDEIVLKALSKDRNQRYENMDKFNRALVKFLYSHYNDFNATDLSYFSRELFREEIKVDKRKLFEFGQINLKPFLTELTETKDKTDIIQDKDEKIEQPNENSAIHHTEQEFDFGFGNEETSSRSISTRGTKVKQTGTKIVNKQNDLNPVKNIQTKQRQKPESPVVKREDHQKSSTPPTKIKKKTKITVLVSILILVIFATFFLTENPTKTTTPTTNITTQTVELENNMVPTKKIYKFGKIILKNFATYKQRLFINGKSQKVSLLGEVEMKIPFETKIILRIEMQDREHFIKEIVIDQEESKIKLTIPKMPLMKFGYLFTSRKCVEGKMFFNLYGEERIETLPLKSSRGIAFPLAYDENGQIIAKSHTIYFKRSIEDIQRRTIIEIKKPDDRIDFCDFVFNAKKR